jgi:hypothetical protein
MIIRRLYTAYTLLDHDDAVAQQLHPLLYEQRRFPTHRTWERRLTAVPQHLPGLLGYFGHHLVAVLTPWASYGRVAAVDSTSFENARGRLAQEAQGRRRDTSYIY